MEGAEVESTKKSKLQIAAAATAATAATAAATSSTGGGGGGVVVTEEADRGQGQAQAGERGLRWLLARSAGEPPVEVRATPALPLSPFQEGATKKRATIDSRSARWRPLRPLRPLHHLAE